MDNKLTAKQEAFAQGIADGLGQADAYRIAYDAEKMSTNNIYSKASVLMSDGKVAERVAQLKAQLQSKQLWSREMSVKALVQAYKEGNGSVKVSAVKELNAMHGYNAPQKIDLNGELNITRIERVLVKK
jgi:hypothetical protein